MGLEEEDKYICAISFIGLDTTHPFTIGFHFNQAKDITCWSAAVLLSYETVEW